MGDLFEKYAKASGRSHSGGGEMNRVIEVASYRVTPDRQGIVIAGPRGPVVISCQAFRTRSGESGDGGRWEWDSSARLVERVWLERRQQMGAVPLRWEVSVLGEPLTPDVLRRLIEKEEVKRRRG